MQSFQVIAQTFDAVANFSATANTATSQWSYRYKPDLLRDGNYPLLPSYGPADGGWNPSNPGAWTLGGYAPEIGVNQTGAGVAFTPITFVWPSGTMLANPGIGELVILSWLSPVTTNLNIDFSFSDLDPNSGNGIAWFVEINNSSNTLNSGSFGNGGATGPMNLSNVTVKAGDRINFVIDPNGDYGYDSTKITATINLVALRLPIAIGMAGTNVVISWPQSGSNAVLQTATAISGAWTNSSGAPVLTGTGYAMTNTIETGTNRFYRLKM